MITCPENATHCFRLVVWMKMGHFTIYKRRVVHNQICLNFLVLSVEEVCQKSECLLHLVWQLMWSGQNEQMNYENEWQDIWCWYLDMQFSTSLHFKISTLREQWVTVSAFTCTRATSLMSAFTDTWFFFFKHRRKKRLFSFATMDWRHTVSKARFQLRFLCSMHLISSPYPRIQQF